MHELPPDAVLRYYRAISPEAFLALLGYEIQATINHDPSIYRICHPSIDENLLRAYEFVTYESRFKDSIWVQPKATPS